MVKVNEVKKFIGYKVKIEHYIHHENCDELIVSKMKVFGIKRNQEGNYIDSLYGKIYLKDMVSMK